MLRKRRWRMVGTARSREKSPPPVHRPESALGRPEQLVIAWRSASINRMKNRHGLAGAIAVDGVRRTFKRPWPKKSDARQYRPELLQWSRKFLTGRRFASAL